jgi:transcriptional regulator with XRE-family HTH domain
VFVWRESHKHSLEVFTVARLQPLDPSLAQSVVRRRRALGWSQNDLALAANLTEGAIAKYETLRCPIPPEKRALLEAALADAERKAGVPA